MNHICRCEIEHLESAGSLPVKVQSTGLRGGRIELSGKVAPYSAYSYVWFMNIVCIFECASSCRARSRLTLRLFSDQSFIIKLINR